MNSDENKIYTEVAAFDEIYNFVVQFFFINDLQADKSPVVVKGPFFPRVVNPRY
jgi:hypothetical protein